FMPVLSPNEHQFGVKVANVFHGNFSKKIPTIHAIVLLFDSATGEPRAMLDGENITAVRTGAASGLASDLLARKDAQTLAIFGAGIQGRAQFEGVHAVRNIQTCLLFDTNRNQAESLADDLSSRFECDFRVAESDRELRKAEIICTATNSFEPVFSDTSLGSGVHINAIGAYTREMSEVPPATVARSKIIVDQRDACLTEAGDLIKPIKSGLLTDQNIHAELGEIVENKTEGRLNEKEITLFKSVGNAIQDLVCANYIFETAVAKNLGTTINL
ncbi:MAG: ornithine cyclodeaminase family protein, partial [Pyrinomonadaceae bacterium]|nr:ornithine cyclodeaminase family protein [Pyrinomonadaceae bacterium]